jgi:hypothetical protein
MQTDRLVGSGMGGMLGTAWMRLRINAVSACAHYIRFGEARRILRAASTAWKRNARFAGGQPFHRVYQKLSRAWLKVSERGKEIVVAPGCPSR